MLPRVISGFPHTLFSALQSAGSFTYVFSHVLAAHNPCSRAFPVGSPVRVLCFASVPPTRSPPLDSALSFKSPIDFSAFHTRRHFSLLPPTLRPEAGKAVKY